MLKSGVESNTYSVGGGGGYPLGEVSAGDSVRISPDYLGTFIIIHSNTLQHFQSLRFKDNNIEFEKLDNGILNRSKHLAPV